ncbi:hypothetical protein COS54_02020 [Candidatus Shapirobacteria bacterium CG03_land_8_20_14_0_80_39_12]|uniref:Uncharacterized protein n=1 Tax=Candidatus Shapirobacteria bacterium CG03_land_8_20_14_0_80_39_12 TaxID=1974879 RepID=A0A2M7BCU3_9BACT|nr:MAG: hypothetical protein COS54_02020 [Candidatus Shapirobacteria bacterium CG03_land_8_20_14_0_80_39_12]
MYPQIIFSLNKGLDKWVGYHFLDHQRGGHDFGKFIIKVHPELSSIKEYSSEKKKRAGVEQYVDSFYEVHEIQLEGIRKKFEEDWRQIARPFFQAIDQIFDHPWPKSPYLAYPSIFPCGPRFLEQKSFQIFYLDQPLISIAHEILHFLFYDYLKKNFPREDLSSNDVWILSEIVNTLTLDSPRFAKILMSTHLHPYPAQKDLLNCLKPLWKTESLNNFLEKGLDLIKHRLK